MRISILALAAALAFSGPALAAGMPQSGGPASEEASPATSTGMTAHVQAGVGKLQTKDIVGAREDFRAAVASPEFSSQPENVHHAVLVLLAVTEATTGMAKEAYGHLTEAGPATGDATDASYYVAMMMAADAAGHRDQAFDATTWVAENSPQGVQFMDLSFMLNLASYGKEKADGGAANRRLLEALWADHYTSPNPYYSTESLWFDLFEAEVAAGNDDKAKEIMAGFVEPETVIKLRCDKRYSRFVTDDPNHKDFQAVLDGSIVTARDLMTAHPRDVEAVNNLAYRLANANRLDEGLKLVDDTLAKVAAAPKDQPAYDDQAEKLQWIYMTRAIILGRLGRTADKLKAQEASRDSALAGGAYSDSVSQPINLGDQYIAENRPQAALDAVKDVGDGDVSPYGKMAAMDVRACAYKQLNDAPKLAETMAYMKAHADDGFSPYEHALLCTGDDNEMAAVLVRRMDDPAQRNQTLYWLQTFLEAPENPFEQQLQTVWNKAEAHPEVKAAIDKYGTVDNYAMFKPIDG